MELKDFWAKTKPFQSVYTHSVVSGLVSQFLLTHWLSEGDRKRLTQELHLDEEELTPFVGYLVSLHDVGKLEYSFQVMDEELGEVTRREYGAQALARTGVRHEKTGRDYLQDLWSELGEEWDSAELFSMIIGAHHQGKTGTGNYKPRDSVWNGFRGELESRMRAFFLGGGESPLPMAEGAGRGAASAILLGLLILSDWIASGTWFEEAESWLEGPDGRKRIREEAERFLRESGLAPQPVDWPKDFCGIWPNIRKEGRRFLQKDLDEIFSETGARFSLVLLEAPMGEGKTEAGLFAALRMARQWGRDGFYVALPTAATANQMVQRVQKLLDTHGLSAAVRLLHSMAWLQEEAFSVHSPDERDEAASWLAPLRRGLLAQFAVGTVDQAMLAAANVKYGVLRLLGLSNKVLIIDEIHSYDTYMNEFLLRLLEWCRAMEIPVVMLSATLPPHRKQLLLRDYTAQEPSGEYPLITTVDAGGALRERIVSGTNHRLRVSICLKPLLGSAEGIAAAAAEEVRDGGCICVLMNTVREAQAVYLALRRIYDGDLQLFHAQFPAGRRAELERECIRLYGKDKRARPGRSILVATQVVEQSLDVDFDAMLTAVAPIDLLIQRLGRIFRHEETPRPETHRTASMTVLIPEKEGRFGPTASVYPECFLKSAIRVLDGRETVLVPEDVARLVRDGYDPAQVPETEVTQWLENQVKEQIDAGAGRQFLLDPPEKLLAALRDGFLYDDEDDGFLLSAKTRLGEPSVRLALLPPEEMERLRPYLKVKDGASTAPVRDWETAEWVMRKSFSVGIRRLGKDLSDLSYTKGDILLTGVKIMETDHGVLRLPDGRQLRMDPELGLRIEGGEA